MTAFSNIFIADTSRAAPQKGRGKTRGPVLKKGN